MHHQHPVLLERDAERAALADAAARAAGGEGSLAIVVGPAGVGKTALLVEARHEAERRGLAVLTARTTPLETQFPYGVVRQLLEPALSGRLAEHRERLLRGGARPAARVLGAPVVEAPPAPGQDASYGVLHGLYWLVWNMAAEAPLMLWIDDVQWCDRPSLRFLVHVGRRLGEMPAAVVSSLRSGEPGAPQDLLDALLTTPDARFIAPRSFSRGAVNALLRREGLAVEDPDLAGEVHRMSGGNPLYVIEILRALRTDGGTPARMAATARPEAIARYVLGRIGRIGPVAVRLARAMSILGRGSLAAAAAVAGLDRADAERAAAALVAADVVTALDPFDFVHPVVRAVVESDLGPFERDRLHLAAARWLREDGAPPEEIAGHVHLVWPAGREWCVRSLQEAAREALARGAPDVAVRHLRRAVAEPPPAKDRAVLLRELGVAEEHAGDAAAIQHLREALEDTHQQPARAESALVLGTALFALFRVEEALKVFRSAVQELGDEHPELALLLDARLITAAMSQPRYGYLASDRLDRLDADETGPAGALGFLLAARSIRAFMDNRREETLSLAHAALAEIVGGRVPAGVAQQALALLFFPLLLSEDFDTLLPLLEAAGAAAEASGVTFDLIAAHAMRSLAAERLGRLAEAEAHARAALEVIRHKDVAGASGWAVSSLVEVLVQTGELEEAERVLRSIPQELVERVEGRDFLIPARGRLRHAQGRHDEALADLMRARLEAEPETAGAFRRRNVADVHWRSAAALVLDELGRRPEAQRLAREELDRSREFGAPRALAVSLRATGLVTRGSEGLALLQEAVETSAGTPAELERARVHVAYGALLRREGRPAQARQPLRTGLDLAASCGARTLAEFARAELAAAGARPRRDRTTGRDALTAAELRVAELAARGETNRAIAQHLFLSLKTVEMHLGRVYRKLGIGSRADLVPALDDPTSKEQGDAPVA